MFKLRQLAYFLTIHFGPLLVFYFVHLFWGLKTGITVSMIFTTLEFIWLKSNKELISPIFQFAALLIFVFGCFALIISESVFFKYESSLLYLFFTIYFGLSLTKNKSIIQKFIEILTPEATTDDADKKLFYSVLTSVWMAYFLIKSLTHFWINTHPESLPGHVSQFMTGPLSLLMMLIGSIGFADKLWQFINKLPNKKSLKFP